MQVATSILEQLGGNRFSAMTGARDFVGSHRTLSFKLPRGAKDGINYVQICLNAADLYDVNFFAMRGLNLRTVATLEGVYADKLREAFTAATGLDTSL